MKVLNAFAIVRYTFLGTYRARFPQLGGLRRALLPVRGCSRGHFLSNDPNWVTSYSRFSLSRWGRLYRSGPTRRSLTPARL